MTNLGTNLTWTTAFLLLVGLAPMVRAAGLPAEPQGPWSQWRGSQGLGVSTDPNLPEVWDAESGQGIKWKTRIPGAGCSSPIVSNGRVFLTTAYEDQRGARAGLMVKIAMYSAIAVFVAGALVRLFVRQADGVEPGRKARRSIWRTFNSALAGVLAVVFLVLVVLIFAFPSQYDATVGAFLQKNFKQPDNDEIDHLFFIAEGVKVALWLNSGAVALLGLALSLHWVRAHSIWRPVGAVLFALVAAGFVVWTPANVWKYRLDLWVRLPFVLPGAVVALWFLFGYLDIQWHDKPSEAVRGTGLKGRMQAVLQTMNRVVICWRHQHLFRPGSALSMLVFGSLVLIVASVFFPANLLLPQIGLQRVVVCLDFDSGQILWQTPVLVAPAERKHNDTTYATPTPAADGQHVVASFGPVVASLDFDGRMLWRSLDPMYIEDSRYGAATSVLIWKDMAIVLQEGEEKSKRLTWMAAFDVSSGDVRWNVSPRNLLWAYTTPLLFEDRTGMKLITSSHENVACFEIDSGQKLWEYKIVLDQLVASMARLGSMLYLGGGTWGPEKLIAMRLTGSGQNTTIEELWSAEEDTPGCASPVAYNGLVFTISDKGVMSAYGAKSGKRHWRKRLGGRYLASLLAGDGKIYACNTKGMVTVVAAEPELKIIAQNKLEGDCRASPAVQDSHLLIRTAEYLYCIAR